MYKRKSLILIVLSLFLLSCGRDDTLPETFEYSNKILGEWQQMASFNLVDASAIPASYDWFPVEEGFTLELFEDGSFYYTKYENCTTGEYFFDRELGEIQFVFDCGINFYGEKTNRITESFAEDKAQNTQLFLMHANGPGRCEEGCNSILERIE